MKLALTWRDGRPSWTQTVQLQRALITVRSASFFTLVVVARVQRIGSEHPLYTLPCIPSLLHTLRVRSTSPSPLFSQLAAFTTLVELYASFCDSRCPNSTSSGAHTLNLHRQRISLALVSPTCHPAVRLLLLVMALPKRPWIHTKEIGSSQGRR